MKKLVKLLVCLFVSSFMINIFSFSFNTQQISNIDDSQVEKEAGTYPVTITYVDEGGTESNTVIYVTIYQRHTVEQDIEAINAYDALIDKGVFKDLSDTDILKIIQAKAWNVKNGVEIPVSIIERKVVDQNQGVYEITISTLKGTSTKVTLLEKEERLMQASAPYIGISEFTGGSNFYIFSMSALLLFVIGLIILLIIYVQEYKVFEKLNDILYKKEKL